MDKHQIALGIKKMVLGRTESYSFYNKKLTFLTGSRPLRRKYKNAKDDVVRNDVLQIEYIEAQFKPHHVLWDIGSHYGHYSIFAATIVNGQNQVFSFEPDEAARAIQTKNIALNHLEEKIHSSNCAVSGEDGMIEFLDMHGNSNSHIVRDKPLEEGEMIKVCSRTINSLAKELPTPDFIKIDTEGAEIEILSAAGDVLANKQVRFICELHPFAWPSFGVKYDAFESLMRKYDRKVTLLDPSRNIADLPFYSTVLF